MTFKQDDLLTVKEAAREMNIAPRTVTDYRHRGLIPYIQYSRKKFLYPRTGITAFIKKSSHEPQLSLF
jgi:excisionase family DNA binding protein